MSAALIIALDAGMPTAVRVSMAIVYLNGAEKPATPSTIADLIGLKTGAVQKALNRLRERSKSITATAGIYTVRTDTGVKGTDTGHPETGVQSNHTDGNGCQTDASVPGTGVETRAGVTNYSLIPTVSTEVVDARTSTRETAANHEQADAAPSAPSSGYPDRLNEVLEAWNGLTNSAGVSWWSFPRKDAERRRVISTLAGIVAEIGAQAALEGIDSLANRYSSNYPPQFRYIRERAEGAKADRARKASKARGAYGGCDDLIGTTTDEEMAEARKLISPEESAEIARIRAEGRKRAIAHIAKLKAQGLMK